MEFEYIGIQRLKEKWGWHSPSFSVGFLTRKKCEFWWSVLMLPVRLLFCTSSSLVRSSLQSLLLVSFWTSIRVKDLEFCFHVYVFDFLSLVNNLIIRIYGWPQKNGIYGCKFPLVILWAFYTPHQINSNNLSKALRWNELSWWTISLQLANVNEGNPFKIECWDSKWCWLFYIMT